MIYFRFGEIGNFQEFRDQWTDGGTLLATDGTPMNIDSPNCLPRSHEVTKSQRRRIRIKGYIEMPCQDLRAQCGNRESPKVEFFPCFPSCPSCLRGSMNYSAEACVSGPIAHAGTGAEFEEIKNSRIFDQRKTGNRATEVGGFTPGIGTGGEDSVDGDPQQNIRHHPQAHRDDSVDQDRGIWSHLRGSDQDTEDSRRSADELRPGTVDQDMGAPENQ